MDATLTEFLRDMLISDIASSTDKINSSLQDQLQVPMAFISGSLSGERRPKLKTSKFHIDWIPPGSNILIIGRRGVGKSHLCTHLLTYKENVVPVVFASKYVVQRYRKSVPASNVVDNFDESKLKTLLHRQTSSGGVNEIILAFDDVTNEGMSLMDNGTVRDIVKYGSSLNITSIFSVQHAGVFDSTFQRNVDFVFIFHDNLIDNQRVLYEKYAHMFPTFEAFQDCLHPCTSEEPYRCLVLNMFKPWAMDYDDRKREGKAPDGVYWYSSTASLPASSEGVEDIDWSLEVGSQVLASDSKGTTETRPLNLTASGSASPDNASSMSNGNTKSINNKVKDWITHKRHTRD